MTKTIALVAAIALAIASAAAYWSLGRAPRLDESSTPGSAVAMAGELPAAEFRSLSCGRNWPDNLPIEPIITKTVDGERSHFVVLDPVTCGMAARDPGYVVSGNVIVLSYSLHAPAEVASCYCEYKSRFSFEGLPASVGSARIEHN